MESKKYNKLVNIAKKKLTDLENKFVVTRGKGEGGKGMIGVGD